MKKIVLSLSLMIAAHAFAAEDCEPASLYLQISNIKEAKGQLFAALHNSEASYLEEDIEPFRSATADVTVTGSQQLRFCAVTEGDYVLSVFHDENNNGELDTGFLGIPKEPYGFSNNLNKMRPPSFEEAAFHFDSTSEINVNLKH